MKKIFQHSIVLVLFSAVILFLSNTLHVSTGNLPAVEEREVVLAGYIIPPSTSDNNVFENFTLFTLSFGILGIAFGLINFGSRKIKLHNSYLENEIKNRTKVLETKHQELAIQNAAYKEALALIKEQNEEIEAAQQDLLMKNKVVQDALEEIKSQNQLLDHERSKLQQAKRIIQEQNTKLLSIARSLDQQVQERTRELSVSNNLLLEKNRELDDFIYKAAHDFRGPIARFKGLSQLINLEYKIGNDVSDHLKHLNDSANHMDSMIRRLSNVYEISARPISLQKISIEDTMTSVFDRLKREESYAHMDIEVHNEIKQELLLDPSLLYLILKNLVGNAIRFFDPLKLRKWIKINLKAEGDYLKITVTDNGLGIKADQQKKIFDLFFVGSELPKGPGLGLYICKIVTKKLNGNIALQYSNAEKETSFEVTIPLKSH